MRRKSLKTRRKGPIIVLVFPCYFQGANRQATEIPKEYQEGG
jgi:hypothetical protein